MNNYYRAKSKQFAEKNNLKEYKHVLHPRTAGKIYGRTKPLLFSPALNWFKTREIYKIFYENVNKICGLFHFSLIPGVLFTCLLTTIFYNINDGGRVAILFCMFLP